MKKWHLVACLLVVTLLAISCGTATPPPELTQQQKDSAILLIKDQGGVRDAAIVQEGKRLSLAIIVDYATSEARAKELGENFVRLVKTFGPEPDPGKTIGKGTFDYLITVATPDQKIVVQGAKVSSSDHITW